MIERELEEKFKRAIEQRGALALKFTSPGMRGVPDRIVLLPKGRVVFAELKRRGGRPSPLQVRCARLFADLGHQVYLVDSPKAIDRFIHEVFGDEA